MWICVIGAPNTCKHKIVDVLVEKEKFVIEKTCLVRSDKAFFTQFNNAMKLFEFQKEVEGDGQDRVITIRSFWDDYEARSASLLNMHELDAEEFRYLTVTYNTLLPFLQPPDAFIWAKSDVQHTQSWASLKEMDGRIVLSDDQIRIFNSYYKKFADNIRTPVIEADMTLNFDEVIDEILYGIETLKATTHKTIWKKKIHR